MNGKCRKNSPATRTKKRERIKPVLKKINLHWLPSSEGSYRQLDSFTGEQLLRWHSYTVSSGAHFSPRTTTISSTTSSLSSWYIPSVSENNTPNQFGFMASSSSVPRTLPFSSLKRPENLSLLQLFCRKLKTHLFSSQWLHHHLFFFCCFVLLFYFLLFIIWQRDRPSMRREKAFPWKFERFTS